MMSGVLTALIDLHATGTLSASIPSPPENVWYLGPLPLRAYAFSIIIGGILAWFILDRRYRAIGGAPEVSTDVTIWMVVFGIVGARIYHVITSPQDYLSDPISILYIWEGGLAIMGAVILGAVGAWLALKRRGLRLAPFADALAPGLLVAQAVGRLGNYFNQELYGAATDLPWGLRVDNPPLPYEATTTFHPTFLYESVWNLTGAVLLVLAQRRFKLGGGQVFWLYAMIYTAGRFWIENLRIDPAQIIAGMRLNAWSALGLFLIGLIMFVWCTKRRKNSSDSIFLDGHEPADEEHNSPTSSS